MDQAHDGVAIVVPVDDQFAPTNAAHKPADGNSRQTWRVLGRETRRQWRRHRPRPM